MDTSSAMENRAHMICCVSCGIAGGDDITLKDCDNCDLVKYCGVKCQKDHRPKHEEECMKRAAELRDEILFKQPESSHLGDCPICCLPLPIDNQKSILMSCCSKMICGGCDVANQMRELERSIQQKCPFCRKALPETNEEVNERLMKRIEANDPVAMCEMGAERYDERDYKTAFEYWTRAAVLGDIEAHFELSCLYDKGEGVGKDEKRELYHLTEAAIGGHPGARHNLGFMEKGSGRMDRAVKHYIIAAKLGSDDSLKIVKNLYKDGDVSKNDFAAALDGHYAAVNATMSPQREEAAKYFADLNEG